MSQNTPESLNTSDGGRRPKTKYVAPELYVYGNISKITAGFGQGGMMDGGGGGMAFKSLLGGGSMMMGTT